MSEEIPEKRYRHHIPAIYLNMARSMFCHVLPYDGAIEDSHNFEEQKLNTAYGAMSVSIVFSYQAIEAFANSQLWRLWLMESANEDRIRMMHIFKNPDSFKQVKELKLSDKLKKLAKSLNIESPTAEKCLWDDFKHLCEDARHFIIHPSPEEFEIFYDRIMLNTKAGKYVEVAEGMISHYFKKMNSRVPEWVSSNSYFTCEGFKTISLSDSI